MPMTILAAAAGVTAGIAAAAGREHGTAEHDAQQEQYREPHGEGVLETSHSLPFFDGKRTGSTLDPPVERQYI